MSLVGDSVVEPEADIIWREVAGEVVLLDPSGNVIMGLNGTGGKAWLLLDGARDLSSVAQAIADEFEQDVGIVESDVLAFANQLLSRGYLQTTA